MGGQVQTTREHEKVTLTIAAGGSVTSEYISLDNKKEMAYFITHLPAGFGGVLFPVVCDTPDGTYEVVYDTDGTLIYADTTSKILPAWYALKADAIYPAHYIKFAAMASTAGTAGTAQAAAGTIVVMGFS